MEALTEVLIKNSDIIKFSMQILVFSSMSLSLFSTFVTYRDSKGYNVSKLMARLAKPVVKYRMVFATIGLVSAITAAAVEIIQAFGSSSVPAEIWAALGILVLTTLCILLAVRYAPQKLLLTVGAAIAFVFAAFFYEAFLSVKDFIETTQSESVG